MQKISFIMGTVLLLVIISAHLIFETYTLFNCGLSAFVVIISVCMMCVLSRVNLKDAFRYSLYTITAFVSIVQLILSVIADSKFDNNVSLFAIITLLVSELVLILAAKYITKQQITH